MLFQSLEQLDPQFAKDLKLSLHKDANNNDK